MAGIESTSIHLEIPYMPRGGEIITIGGMKLPYRRVANPHATIRRETVVPEAIALHTSKPFKFEDVEDRPRTLRKHVAEAWGMTIPCDVEVMLFPKGVRINSPDHHVWSWIQHFFEEHGSKAMKIVAAREGGLFGNVVWVDDKPAKEFVLLPMKGRTVHFGYSDYKLSRRYQLADKTPMVKPTPARAEMITNPV